MAHNLPRNMFSSSDLVFPAMTFPPDLRSDSPQLPDEGHGTLRGRCVSAEGRKSFPKATGKTWKTGESIGNHRCMIHDCLV